jgi:hypothetical protein
MTFHVYRNGWKIASFVHVLDAERFVEYVQTAYDTLTIKQSN